MKENFLALQNKFSRWSLKYVKNRNCEFIRTYGGQVSHLLIHLSSLTFAMYIYRPQIRNFVKENKPFEAIKATTKNKNLSQIYIIERL